MATNMSIDDTGMVSKPMYVLSGGQRADGELIWLASGRKTDCGFTLAAFLDCKCVSRPGFETPKPFGF